MFVIKHDAQRHDKCAESLRRGKPARGRRSVGNDNTIRLPGSQISGRFRRDAAPRSVRRDATVRFLNDETQLDFFHSHLRDDLHLHLYQYLVGVRDSIG